MTEQSMKQATKKGDALSLNRLSSRIKKLIAVSGVATAVAVVAATPAYAAYDEVHCYVQPYSWCSTAPPYIPSHSSQHWVRVMGSWGLALDVYDHTNGRKVWSGTGNGRWVTIYGLYSPEYFAI